MGSWLCETNASQLNLRPCSLRGWQVCSTSYLPCLMVTLTPVPPLPEHSPVEEEKKNIRNTLVRSTPLIVKRAWTTHKGHTHNTRSLVLLFPGNTIGLFTHIPTPGHTFTFNIPGSNTFTPTTPAPLNYTPSSFAPLVFSHYDHTHYILVPAACTPTHTHTHPYYPFPLTPRSLST